MTSTHHSRPSLELWGGPECTVARVGPDYVDQLELTGHAGRSGDIELFADLGLAAIRYPVLWERIAHDGWRWAEGRLTALRSAGVRPIVGLIHHGSGPRHTSLLDEAFPAKFAAYARAVAERFPWVEEWTPVNEPLTTARFSALYGHWYPHAADDLSFARALLAQCRGIVRAMEEIRRVNPAARLVQTEDLGRTYSTPRLAYQAEYENERRWVSFDLLCGELRAERPMYEWLLRVGIPRAELEWFREHPCAPNVIGLNHYLSGERFLDESLERYAPEGHGGNGLEHYADVLAHRAITHEADGFAGVLREAWERYRRPLALTEVQNGCTREEQLRWLDEAWCAARAARGSGVDVRAVTVWALLGAYDWDSLLTRRTGRYESGAFDVAAGAPRPTAVARMAESLARTGAYDHPVLETPGWWRRPLRLAHPPRRRLLVTGATGTLGRACARICDVRGLPYVLLGRDRLDIAEPGSVAAALDTLQPWAVVNAAGYVRVDDAEADEDRCRRENAVGPRMIAEACARRGIGLVTFSSDLVFDGGKRTPYVEWDPSAPLSAYGRSKAEAERSVLEAMPEALVVRTSAFFGPWDEHNFATRTVRAMARGETVRAPADVSVSPTYVPDLVNASLDLLIDGEHGLWHLANSGAVSWASFARACASARGLAAAAVEDTELASLGLPAARPTYSVLATERGAWMAPLDDALHRWAAELEVAA